MFFACPRCSASPGRRRACDQYGVFGVLSMMTSSMTYIRGDHHDVRLWMDTTFAFLPFGWWSDVAKPRKER